MRAVSQRCLAALSILLAGSPAAVLALPLASHAVDAAMPAFRRDAMRAVPLPFVDDTTPCALTQNYGEWSVSPLDKPATLRSQCAREAEQGNLTAEAIYGEMMIGGYGARPDAARGTAMLESAAADGSPLAQRALGSLFRSGMVLPHDEAAARAWFEAAARDGDAISADLLGTMSANGEDEPVDYAAAYRYFVEAAEAGSANGAANAARLVLAGHGVPRDPAVAMTWLSRGATGGDVGAQFLLGLMLVRGDPGIPRDAVKGAAWLRVAAIGGSVDAAAALGDLYVAGVGVAQDQRLGFRLMEAAARAGSTPAESRLGYLYESGTGVSRNDLEARIWYQKAAIEGDTWARFGLADLYRSGRGGPADPEAALGWMQGAAEAGLASAQNDLGVMLRDGAGTKADPAAAKAWFVKADAQGLGVASFNLANYALHGVGEPENVGQAFQLARRGAERGNPTAAVMAASMAWQGQGTPVDRPQAIRWYRTAADGGNVQVARWLGNQYLSGTVVVRDQDAGLHYLKVAADAGDPTAGVWLGAYLTEHHLSLSGKTGMQWLQVLADQHVPLAYLALGYAYWHGQTGVRDQQTALSWISRGAEAGDPASQAWLCTIYAYGDGTPRRPADASRWCRVVAAKGNVVAMRVLASSGLNLAAPDDRAYWLWKLADREDPKYQSMLGDAYDMGDGVPADFAAATYWFRRAAEHGNVSAEGSLAWHLLTGLGGRTDEYEAFTWALRAAPKSTDAMEMVGLAYLDGRGVERDPKAARSWLEKAAAAGSQWAESDIAWMYETGAGVSRDEAVALDWHRRAAARGADPSEIALALQAVASGTEAALPSNETRWLVPADMASTLWRGPGSSAVDAAGHQWDGLSSLNEALLGNALMQYATGIRFLTGDGVPRDRAVGAAWIARAHESFAGTPGLAKYAAATQIIEGRLAQRLGDDEKQRAAHIEANLITTVR
jgi:uncharacterized protein